MALIPDADAHDPCLQHSTFLLSMEEARMDATSPEPSVLSLDSSLSRYPIPTPPPCSDDDDSVGMNSLEGNHDDDNKQWYERIQSPTGPLPYHEADNKSDNAGPYEFDLGMTGNWMCVYDLDSVCLDLDNDNDNDSADQDVPVLPRYSHVPRCAPVLPIPAVPLSSSPYASASAPAIPTGFIPEHLREVFFTGLLPHVIEWFQSSDLAALSSSASPAKTSSEPAWNGYLPLAPYLSSSSSSSSSAPPRYQRRKRRARSEIGESIIRPRLSPPGEEPSPLQHVALFAPNSFDEEDVDVELVYSPPPEDAAPAAAPAAAAPAAGDNKNRRRPPNAQGSMSLTPSAAAAVGTSVSKDVKHGKGKEVARSGQVGTDLEQVHVNTPGADRTALKDLPALRDAPPTKREELFVMKLKLCSVIFSFDDPTADKRGKDMKRQTLLELVDYVNTPAGQKIFTESVMGDLMAMVSANVCRALPPATDDFDPEEDEPVLEPAWPHLQVAYEFFLRFIVSSEVNAKAAKKYVDQKFCLQLVELFDSEDPRERDYLKTILHRIYGKFMSHRSFIRRAISNVFYRFVYETERHNGIGELLEILGSIINGFAIPLKKEHLQFLVRALIPLHKPKCVALYHQQLSYCIIQYVEKDADTATPILNGFFKCWPWSCSGKQVMFLNELEEILELLGGDQLAQVSTMLFTNLARCLDSDHFQVVERALFLWNNEHLVSSGCLSRLNAQTVLPIIYGPLYKNSSGHWNATVEGLAQNVLKMYMEYDLALYDKCTAAYFRDEEEAKKKLEALNERWHEIEQMAVTKLPALMAK